MRTVKAVSFYLALALIASCAGPDTSGSTIPVTGSSGTTGGGGELDLDLSGLPTMAEATLAGMVGAELALRSDLRTETGMAAVLGEDGEAFLERIDDEMAAYGLATMEGIASDAGIGPLAARGAAIGLTPLEIVADWGGSLQAVSGNFTMSSFLGMVVSEWQRLADSDWQVDGELEPNVHDSVHGGVAEHSEIRTSVNGAAAGDHLDFTIEVTATATLTSVETNEVIATYESVGHGEIHVAGCPDPEGVAEGEFTLELEEQGSGVGGASAGGSSSLDGPFRIFNGNDARLIRTEFQGGVGAQGHGAGPSGQSLDWSMEGTFPVTIPASGGIITDVPNSTFQETNAPQGQGTRAAVGLILTAAQFLSGVAAEAESFWRSGKCIDLETTEESKKVKPAEEISIDVTSHQHFDNEEVEAQISGDFEGKESMDPGSGTLVDYPANFTVTAGREAGEKAIVKLEQKSKRGIGKKTLEFEVEPQDLLFDLDGTYQLSVGPAEIDVRFVISQMRLTRGEDGIYRGSGTGNVVGGSVLSGNCTATVDAPVSLTVEGQANEEDADLVRLKIPIESLGGSGNEVCPEYGSVGFPAAAAVGPIVAAAGQREVRVGEPATMGGGGVQATVTLTRVK